jgi:trigger factor
VKSAIETLNPTRVKLTVEVPLEELKPSLDAAYKSIARDISVPGFRPGKVPARIIEQRVGRGAVLQEAVNQALPDFYGQAMEAHQVRPLSQPDVDIQQLPLAEGEQLVFTAEVYVRPELTLPDFGELTVSVDAIDEAALDANLEERLTTLRQRFGTLVGVERAAESGDFVSIDLTAAIDGQEIDTAKGISYEIGSATMLDGMDDALVGLSALESATFTAPLAGGDRAGEPAEITVLVSAVKERQLPDLDDDFAQLASEFDTLEELRADVRAQAERALKFEQGIAARDKVLDLLLERVDVPLPDGLIEAEVHEHLEGEERLDDEEHRAEVDEQSRKTLATQLVLDAVAEREEVSVSQQDLIQHLVMTAQQYGMEPGEFAKVVEERDQIPAMVAEVSRRKALVAVLTKAQVVDGAGVPVDLTSVLGDQDEDEVEPDQGGAGADDAGADDAGADAAGADEAGAEGSPEAGANRSDTQGSPEA